MFSTLSFCLCLFCWFLTFIVRVFRVLLRAVLARAKEKNLSPSYIRTLEHLKAHWEKEQEITSEAK